MAQKNRIYKRNILFWQIQKMLFLQLGGIVVVRKFFYCTMLKDQKKFDSVMTLTQKNDVLALLNFFM